MSPASKSKSKDKLVARAVKEQHKASSKPSSTPANGGNGNPASAYNPVLGTFHTVETAPSASPPTPQNNGRFRTIDETEDHCGSSLGTTAEYDSLSNNESCSGESEDQKEKTITSTTPRTESIPGSDIDKREKVRQKNERKHQRQREKRAQELHERCSGYLMSRKLEALAQQLVAMGVSSERATMALILNEGRAEQSVAWLFDGGEESKQQLTNLESGVNLKIDITDELARIADMEVRFKCSKQEVERAVVACEGDLEKAEETLKAPNQEPANAPAKLEESAGLPSVNGYNNNKLVTTAQDIGVRTQMRGVAASVSVQQQRMDERDLNYPKPVAIGTVSVESANKNLQSLTRIQSTTDWTRPQVAAPVEKRWPSASSSPSVSYPLGSNLQVAVPPAKADTRYTIVGNEVKTSLQAGTVREPVIMMQRPQSINMKQNLPTTSIGISSPPTTTGWYPNGIPSIETMKAANGGGSGQNLPNMSISGPSIQQFYLQNHYQQRASSSAEYDAAGWGGSWNMTRTSSSLAVPSSLGLFTGSGSSGPSGSSPPVDWSTGGLMPPRDYSSIDWSLDSTPLRPSSTPLRPSSMKNDQSYNSVKAARPVVNGGVFIPGLQQGSHVTDPSPSVGSHEWTSPFGGKDLFRVPRQFVTFPPL